MRKCKLCSNNVFYKHSSHSVRTKGAYWAIYPGNRSWPTIVFEIGYEESYDDLGDDVKLLLEGSAGEISKVIIVKIEPLQKGETEVQRGFVEMWHLKNGRAIQDGGRKVIFYHYLISGFTFTNTRFRSYSPHQGLMHLRNSRLPFMIFSEVSSPTWRARAGRGVKGKSGKGVSLPFDPLRDCIQKTTRRDLVSPGECSQRSGTPVGPGEGTAKSPGPDGTAKCGPQPS